MMKSACKAAVISTLAAGMGLAAATGAALANPVNPQGWTAGLQLASPLPEGVFFIDTGTWFERSPEGIPGGVTVDAGVNVPLLLWSTPVTFLGGRLEVIGGAPEVALSYGFGAPGGAFTGGASARAFYNPVGLVGLAWDLGGGFSFSNFVGAYIPLNTSVGSIGALGPTTGGLGLGATGGLGGDFWTFIEGAAIAYNHDGWSLSANGFYGHSGNETGGAQNGLQTQPDTLSVDFAATKHFGKIEVGLVGYASTDISSAVWNTYAVPGQAFASAHYQSQVALGGLVGYDFGPVIGQLYVTRDVYERNYTGYDTRIWGRVIIPLWVASKAAPAPAVVSKY
jgi:hypothetical protein